MPRKILKWVIVPQREYERLIAYEKAFKILCNMTTTLIDMQTDLIKIL